ncbi:MAG: DUF4382 domain-containing protein [Candidatus Aenigmarchaeota archaeon]|nr:DUF4382 domain-containing protein [Candidatus Aenigmarchaeota archaeon]
MAGCTGTGQSTGGNQEGRAVATMADAAADMGAVSSVKVTVDSVRVHSATEGWVTISSAPHTYDLLQLKAEGKQALLADTKLDAGTYDQLRLDISSVVVTDAQGSHQAKLPSGELKIVGDLVVKANSTAAAVFDFKADESLHVTGEGQYIMAPVVQLETRQNADVTVRSSADVAVSGGSVVTNVKVGMDAQGRVGVGLGIPANANLSIGSGSTIIVGSGIGTAGSAGGSASGSAGIGGSAGITG